MRGLTKIKRRLLTVDLQKAVERKMGVTSAKIKRAVYL